jgi:hypothetical protein
MYFVWLIWRVSCYELNKEKPDYELISYEAMYLPDKLSRHFNLVEVGHFLPVKRHLRPVYFIHNYSQLCLFDTEMWQNYIATESQERNINLSPFLSHYVDDMETV